MKPNLFIVGAPKCGTTALYHYMRSHPDVYFCPLKEPHWFATDIPSRLSSSLENESDYLNLFSGARSEKFQGESSVWYLYSNNALKNIYKFNPNAKLLVMIRNPIHMAQSLHAQMVYSSEEDDEDFESAWNKQSARLSGENLPSFCREPALLQYMNACSLGSQITRACSIFPESSIRILFLDEMIQDARSFYLSVLEFLDLPDDGRSEFPKINQRKQVKSRYISIFTQRTVFKRQINKYLRLKRGLGLENRKIGVYSRMKDMLRKYNTTKSAERPIGNRFYNELVDTFKPEIQLLEEHTGRNLSHWSQYR